MSQRIDVRSGLELHAVRWEPPATSEVAFVLVHGLASNCRLWDGVGNGLANRGHPVSAVDLRGHGLSDKPDDGYDMATVTDDLARFIDRIGWTRPVVVGQSWGGNVAVELAATRGDAVSGIACIDGGVIDLRARFREWADAARHLAPPSTIGRPVREIEALIRTQHPDWSDTAVGGVMASFEHRPDGTVAPWLTIEHHMKVLRGLWEHDPFERFGRIEVPVLLVPAATDEQSWTDDKRGGVERAVHALATSRVEWIEGDHDLHAQRPTQVAEILHEAATDLWLR